MTESKRKEDVIPFPSPRSGLESQVVDTDYGVSGGRYTEKALLQALEALRRRNYELALLQRASQAFNSTLELDQVLAAVLEEVRLLLNAVACSVWLVDSETGQLICWQATGVENEVVRGWQLAPGEGIVGWVAQSGRVLIVPDAREDDRHFKEIDEQTGLEMCAILSVPLETKGQVIGVLQVLDTEVNRFSPIDLTLLEPLAAAAATAIDNARLVEALRQRTHDLERRNDELDAFAQTVAHDLKIPLGYIVGFAEALRECGDGMEFEDICHHLQTIAWSGRKMEEIVDELLLLAGVRSAEVELQPLDMAGIVAQAQERLSGLIAKHQAKIVHPQALPAQRQFPIMSDCQASGQDRSSRSLAPGSGIRPVGRRGVGELPCQRHPVRRLPSPGRAGSDGAYRWLDLFLGPRRRSRSDGRGAAASVHSVVEKFTAWPRDRGGVWIESLHRAAHRREVGGRGGSGESSGRGQPVHFHPAGSGLMVNRSISIH